MADRCPACNSQGKGGPRLCDDRWHSRPRTPPPIESIQTKASVMADPTIEEDLAALKHALNKAAMLNSTLPAFDALERVAAALKDREHLEEAARVLTQCLGYALDERPIEMPGDPDEKQLLAWLERERARKQGSGTVVKSTP